MAPRTHYESLEVRRDASAEEIRASYRALAQRLHPDVCDAPDAATRFAAIAEAYDVLSDAGKRRVYDRSLSGLADPSPGARGGPAPAVPHYTWSNIAGRPSDEPEEASDFDELYDAFFGS